jgi:hypothetical protein
MDRDNDGALEDTPVITKADDSMVSAQPVETQLTQHPSSERPRPEEANAPNPSSPLLRYKLGAVLGRGGIDPAEIAAGRLGRVVGHALRDVLERLARLDLGEGVVGLLLGCGLLGIGRVGLAGVDLGVTEISETWRSSGRVLSVRIRASMSVSETVTPSSVASFAWIVVSTSFSTTAERKVFESSSVDVVDLGGRLVFVRRPAWTSVWIRLACCWRRNCSTFARSLN